MNDINTLLDSSQSLMSELKKDIEELLPHLNRLNRDSNFIDQEVLTKYENYCIKNIIDNSSIIANKLNDAITQLDNDIITKILNLYENIND